MRNVTLIRVQEFLNKLQIVHEIYNGQLRVSRDSIVNKIKAMCEEDSYERLKYRLNDLFELRFYWPMKDDDWLYLDTIGEK
jgi:hypothetical protein